MNPGFGRALETYLAWMRAGEVNPHTLARFYSSIRESGEWENRKVSQIAVLQTYCDLMLHRRLTKRNHIAFVRQINGNVEEYFDGKRERTSSDKNEWIRELYRCVFLTRELREGIQTYFSSFGCPLENSYDNRLLTEIITLTVNDMNWKMIDLGDSLLSSDGSWDSDRIEAKLGFLPKGIVTGFTVMPRSPFTIAEFTYFRSDGAKALINFPVSGPGIDHYP